jgi:twinkle protein
MTVGALPPRNPNLAPPKPKNLHDMDWPSDIKCNVRPGGPNIEIYVECPKCKGNRRKKNRKPLGVNPSKGAWYCWHCHAGGSLLKGGWTDDPDYERLRAIVLPPREIIPAPETDAERLWRWLKEVRGIEKEVAVAEGVEIADRWCMECEDRVPSIAFRYFKGGAHVHTKFRCEQKHFNTDNQTDRCMYGYDLLIGDEALPPWEQVIITEGELDALTLRQLGYQKTLSMPDGAQQIASMIDRAKKRGEDLTKLDFSAARIGWLDDEKVVRALLNSQKVLLAIDTDEVGTALSDEIARRLGLDICRVIHWPEGVKDANDTFTRFGADAVHEAIDKATPYPVEGLLVVDDFEEEVDRIQREGMPGGLSTGFESIDRYVKVQLGQLWMVLGVSSSGKSHLMNHLLANLIRQHGWNVSIFSPEWQPVPLHAISLMEVYLGKSFDLDPERGSRIRTEEYQEAKRWLSDHVTFLLPHDRTVDSLIEKMKIARARRGVRVFLLDPWLEIQHPVGNHDKLDYIENAITKFKEFFLTSEALGIIVHHPGKPTSRVAALPGQIPAFGMYGFRDASGFTNKADVILEVIRKPDYETEVKIEKVRYKHLGEPGDALLKFDRETGKYSDLHLHLPDQSRVSSPGAFMSVSGGDPWESPREDRKGRYPA